MRIISNFHDYYDTILAHGFDESIVYDRKSVPSQGVAPAYADPDRRFKKIGLHLQELTMWARQCASINQLPAHGNKSPDPKGRRFACSPLAFCVGAKPIKALWLTVSEPIDATSLNDEPARRYGLTTDDEKHFPPQREAARGQRIAYEGPVFDPETLTHWVGPWIDQEQDEKRRGKFKNNYGSWRDGDAIHRGLLGMMDWLKSDNAPASIGSLMAEAGCVCAVANSRGTCAENPRLADFQLFRGLDPHSCMQELAMAVANLASPEKDIAPTPDRYKALAHGFDQASFRKQPTKHADPKQPKRPHPDAR